MGFHGLWGFRVQRSQLLSCISASHIRWELLRMNFFTASSLIKSTKRNQWHIVAPGSQGRPLVMRVSDLLDIPSCNGFNSLRSEATDSPSWCALTGWSTGGHCDRSTVFWSWRSESPSVHDGSHYGFCLEFWLLTGDFVFITAYIYHSISCPYSSDLFRLFHVTRLCQFIWRLPCVFCSMAWDKEAQKLRDKASQKASPQIGCCLQCFWHSTCVHIGLELWNPKNPERAFPGASESGTH